MFINDELRLSRLDYVPTQKENDNAFGKHPLSIVHDMDSDIVYIQDTVLGNCSVGGPHLNSSTDLKNKVQSASDLKELLDFSWAGWIYSGKRVVRGIHCDIWIGRIHI